MKRMRLDLNITENHIKTGKRESCRFCPIALALSEKLNPGIHYRVTKNVIWVAYTSEDLEDIALPDEALIFIRNFDHRLKVSPFTFSIEIPKRFLKN